jgi:hypothetical protein
MALTAYQAVWEHSKATGNARLALLALAEHVNESEHAGPDVWMLPQHDPARAGEACGAG